MVPRAPDKEILVSETINGSLSVSNDVIADIAVSADENGLTVDLHVVLENGVNMKSVCHNLSSSVAFTLQEIAQIDPASLKIGIHIDALKSRLN